MELAAAILGAGPTASEAIITVVGIVAGGLVVLWILAGKPGGKK